MGELYQILENNLTYLSSKLIESKTWYEIRNPILPLDGRKNIQYKEIKSHEIF